MLLVNAFDACGVLKWTISSRATDVYTNRRRRVFVHRCVVEPAIYDATRRGPGLSGGLGLAGQELGHANVGSTLHLLRLERSVLDIFNVPGGITSATPSPAHIPLDTIHTEEIVC